METAQPGIQNAASNLTPSSLPVKPKNFKEFLSKNKVKLILGFLAVIVLAELVIGSRMLFSPNEIRVTPTKVESLSPAQIVLSSNKKSINVDDDLVVDVRVVTGGNRVDSTDVILKFDPTILRASGSGTIKTGGIFEDYPVAGADNNNGLIKISGTYLTGKGGFSGIGSLATINFKVISGGNAKVSVEFEKDQTADSNVVKAGSADDILGEVHDLNIPIGVSETDPKEASNRCEGYTQYCLTDDNKTGTQVCKDGMMKSNACVFDPLLTVSCSVCKI